jgi:hypothetical protein
VTVQAWSPRSTLTTFKPAVGDQAVDAFIPPAAAYSPKALPPRPCDHEIFRDIEAALPTLVLRHE